MEVSSQVASATSNRLTEIRASRYQRRISLRSRPVLDHVFKVLSGRDWLSFFLSDASYKIAVYRTEARYCGDLAH